MKDKPTQRLGVYITPEGESIPVPVPRKQGVMLNPWIIFLLALASPLFNMTLFYWLGMTLKWHNDAVIFFLRMLRGG